VNIRDGEGVRQFKNYRFKICIGLIHFVNWTLFPRPRMIPPPSLSGSIRNVRGSSPFRAA
jgi:hypothetical protein